MSSERKTPLGGFGSLAVVEEGLETSIGVGAKNGSTVTVAEYGAGEGSIHRSVLTLASTPVTMTDEAATCAYGGVKVYDMPTGRIAILGAIADLSITKDGDGISTTFEGDFSIGTVPASNNATLTSTEANIVPSTAIPAAVAGVTTGDGTTLYTLITALTDNSGGTSGGNTIAECADIALSTSGGNTYSDADVNAAVNTAIGLISNAVSTLAAKVNELIAKQTGAYCPVFDGSSTAKDIYLNFLIDDNKQDGGGTLSVSGTITLLWINLDNVA